MYHRQGLGVEPPASRDSKGLRAETPENEQFFEKQAISNAIGSHSGRVQSHWKELDF